MGINWQKVRILLMVLVISLLVMLFSVTAVADGSTSQGIGPSNGTCGDNLTWTLSDGILTITGTGAMYDYDDGQKAPWESQTNGIQKVVVTPGITRIGDYAFVNSSLKTIELSSGLETIGEKAFFSSSIEHVEFPETLVSIDDTAFGMCFSLKTVVLPDNVTEIGSSAFYECYLEGLTISKNLKNIPYSAFSKCQMEELIIPEGVETIADSVFFNSKFKVVRLPSTIKTISSEAFNACYLMQDVYYNGTRDELDEVVIGNNTNLTSAIWHFSGSDISNVLTLPPRLTIIEDSAFENTLAQEIVIPQSVEIIGSRAFACSPTLKLLYFEGSPVSIADDILTGCENVIISCSAGNSVESWANNKGYKVIYH